MFNWSLWLAFFTLYHDIRGAIKYHIRTFIPVKLSDLTIHNADISKSSPYEAVNYFMLEKLLKSFRVMSSYHSIVDLGCGKGRVMVVSAYFGFRHIIGIDFAKELCEEATRNMKITEKKVPGITWRVINAHVLDYSITPEDSVFFMFNPFKAEILMAFLDKLEESCSAFPRDIYFLYASPEHATVLQDRGYKIVFNESLMNLNGMIFSKSNNQDL